MVTGCTVWHKEYSQWYYNGIVIPYYVRYQIGNRPVGVA